MKSISKIKVSHISLTPNQKHSFLKTVEPVQSTRAPLAGSRSGLSCKSVFVDPDLHLWGSDRVLQISCCTILTRVYQVVYFRYGSRVEFIHPLLSQEEWRESSKSHLGIKLFRFCASIKYCTESLCDNWPGVELQPPGWPRHIDTKCSLPSWNFSLTIQCCHYEALAPSDTKPLILNS